MSEPATGTCKSCGLPFDFNAAFYTQHGLAPPLRCYECRTRRRASRVRLRGFVETIGRRFMLLRSDDGEMYFASPPEPALRRGDPVTFEVVLGELPDLEGRRPPAYDVVPA